ATVSTPNGLHTFPTRDGAPVILDPKTARNASRPIDFDVPVATRRLRIQRLIGLDDRKGVRGDLGNARRAKEVGHTTWVDGRPIDDAIASYEDALARYQAILAELDDAEDAGDDAEPSALPTRNGAGSVVLTPKQAVDWIAELAMVRADRLVGGTRRIENGHRAMCGVLILRPICIADVRDVALVLALAEREARGHGLGELKIVHSTARAIDALDQLAADRATQPPRNDLLSDALGVIVNNKDLQNLVGGLARVASRIVGGIGLEAAKSKLASVGVGAPVLNAFEKELNKEGLSLGPLAKPSPMIGSLDAMTPQALAGRWLAAKL
ncbi:MAG TPA: hypothetical protein VGO00_15250, partial [Kofleriaceae bacterium]|nr:hypothetical protein [Kofleriaceae bacterium]